MATNFIQPGDIMEYTAPSGGTTAGVGVLIGNLVVIALDTAAEGDKFRGATSGVWSHVKPGSQSWSEGAIVYWDNSGKKFTTTSTSNYRAGVAAAAVGSGSGETTGLVRLNGIGVTAVGGAAP